MDGGGGGGVAVVVAKMVVIEEEGLDENVTSSTSSVKPLRLGDSVKFF